MKKKNELLTNANRNIIMQLWIDFVSIYKLDVFIAFLLLVIVAATASIYPYLIQLVFDSLIDSKTNEWITIPLIIACIAVM